MITDYLLNLETSNHPVLAEMESKARDENFPIIGAQCGRRLLTLALAIGARRVFEMGSGFGYSTVWFCHAVGEGGEVVHTDGDPQNTASAHTYLERAGLIDRVRFLNGDAVGLLTSETGPFDVVLIDIDKHGYPDALEAAVPKLREGGLILAHNAKWSGRVADPSETDEATEGIRAYNQAVFRHPELATYIDPVDDGLAISLKLNAQRRAPMPI